ncbi:MAG: AAA family ATPase [Spirochaetales bacterium]|nr:AAA family ATPase [Spirochaetales bacterium]
MDLFSVDKNNSPLADRMRPRTLDEYFGQTKIIGPGRLLRRMIQADKISSVIFYGPPGTGKTTLAKIIANTTRSKFESLNAVLAGKKELREAIDAATENKRLYDMKTILFIDEVHRWNKAQQDALLPWVENGTITLIGATTENPFFDVIPALVSRSRLFCLELLSNEELREVALAAIKDKERGYGNFSINIEENALEHIINVASGDARNLLNALELAVETSVPNFPPENGTKLTIDLQTAEESIQQKAILYDKEGDYHYDTISAFIKSIRGSDPDASLYWLAKMVEAGENPKFIFRRLIISACEDVGMADPNAITIVQSLADAFDRIGMPEGRFMLSQATIYLATTEKSNTTLGLFDAIATVKNEKVPFVPSHLKDNSRDSGAFGDGQNYLYPHAYKDHWVVQQYLPAELADKIFYQPSDVGYERKILDKVKARREAQIEASLNCEMEEGNFSFSQADKGKDIWLDRLSSNFSEELLKLKNDFFSEIKIKRHSNVLDLNAGSGLLLWETMKHNPEGLSAAVTNSQELGGVIRSYSSRQELENMPEIFVGTGNNFAQIIAPLTGIKFDYIFARDLIRREEDIRRLAELVQFLEDGGEIVCSVLLYHEGTKFSQLEILADYKEQLLAVEEEILSKPEKILCREEIMGLVGESFAVAGSRVEAYKSTRVFDRRSCAQLIDLRSSFGAALQDQCGQEGAQAVGKMLGGARVPWQRYRLMLRLQKK